MERNSEFKEAVDIFVQGEFCFSRQSASQIHFYDSIKHLAFGEKVSGRADEFITYNLNPTQVIDTINKLEIEKSYWLTVLSDEEPYSYNAKGYAVKSTEFLMMLNLNNLSFKDENKTIKRIETKEEAQHINHFFEREIINPKKLYDPNLRFYISKENGQPVSYGSYALLEKTVFLNNVFTSKEHRGKGMAKGLCRKMLIDAKLEGAVQSVLVASQMGHPLYLKLGYKEVSKMWVFERKS